MSAKLSPMVQMHLNMLRMACMTVITAIDMVLAPPDEDAPPVAAPSASPEEGREFDPDPLKCGHPKAYWTHVPAMGNANRYLCRCGEEMEGTL